ncbi:acetyl-CoA synthetase-like protein [Calocera viscosa TUFC12733]|uniref:Acetyl-CoA synthetase-like protein n=1 Tax=Calocera viscosa (strain TUFC12733) TaxID=1330018 RepID=A0A167JSK4_CALVF|nr:acetyl-CoA synthetase-like protein [Calocera viscosa TUFC12733]
MPAGDAPDDSLTTTARRSASFTMPPMENPLGFAQWLDWHLEKSHDQPWAVLVGSDSDEDVIITWGELARASFRLAARLREEVEVSEEQRKEGVRIAILANTDALTYSTLIFGILRAGFVAFPISTRNSVPALEHLIKKTSSPYIFGSIPTAGVPSSALQETTAELLDLLPSIRLLEVPHYTELYPRLNAVPVQPYNPQEDAARTPMLPPVFSFPEYEYVTKDSPIIFLHSSGSTSFPKPIPMSHRFWLSLCRHVLQDDHETASTRWGLLGLPLFHAMSVFLIIGVSPATGTTTLMFKPSKVPTVPSPEVILNASKRGKADYICAVPSFCVEWSQDENVVKYLATLKGLMYGGGPLPKESGDQLAKSGVKMAVGYGTTEVGMLFTIDVKKDNPMDWNYGQLHADMQVKLIPEANGLYRIIVLDSDAHPIAVYNQPDIKAFDTNDLLEQHPTKKDLWKVVGRADDQIMMSNGEKTNPGPMENIIGGNRNVQACLMFGRARTQVGIAIEPANHVRVTSEEELAAFRNLVWPDIEKANAFAPQHSRIFKEFILVTDPKKKGILRTPKGSLARNASLQQLSDEIDALYAAAEQPTKAEYAQPPTSWNDAALHSFVVRLVNGVLRENEGYQRASIDESLDLFQQGCDSLQATYIRSAIVNALRQAPKPEGKSDIAATSVPHNLVFGYPTVKRLVGYMAKTVAAVMGHQISDDEDTPTAIEGMYAMIEKYAGDFPMHNSVASGEIVLLTGSTGTLGTYLLQRLLQDERVERVYAVNRGNTKHDLLARQRHAFADRGLDTSLLESTKLRLIESDVASDNLGFSPELFQEVRESVSAIIHNAWRLDFNLSLASFEPNVRASRGLVDLALRAAGPSPAQLIFTSSIGTLMKWSEPGPVPEAPIPDPVIASGTGYSESKWITERIMLAAAEQQGLRPTIWRVGQLAGSVQNGAWNTTDWLPLIVKSGERLKILPSLPGRVSWIPIDMAAQSIIDVMHGSVNSPSGTSTYLHLVHPHPVSWDSVLAPIARQMDCRLVPFSEWLNALSEAAKDDTEVTRNPAIKLLDFYRGIGEHDMKTEQDKTKEAMGMPELETKEAEARSETLRNVRCLGEEDALKWMGYWKKRDLFS